VLSPAAALLVFSVALAAAPAEAGRRGKVVRIEHSRGTPGRSLTLCMAPDSEKRCFGTPPRSGETGLLVGRDGVAGSFRISRVEPFSGGSCVSQNVWSYEGDIVGQGTSGDARWLIFGGGFDPVRAATLDDIPIPDALSGGSVEEWIPFDANGDGAVDTGIIASACGGNGRPTAANGMSFCVASWQLRAGLWTQLQVDVIRACT